MESESTPQNPNPGSRAVPEPQDPRKARGIRASNLEFLDYDQVEKARRYQLAEGGGEEVFDEDFEIRTCDLSMYLHGDAEARASFVRELGNAMSEIGFAILVGHGVDTSIYERAERDVCEFFESIPLDEKLRFRAARHGSVSQGYFPITETSDIHPDLVEGWVFCRRAFDLGELEGKPHPTESFWPRAELEARFRPLVLAQEPLFQPIMSAILEYLGCDPSMYADRLRGTNFGLRLNYYPSLDAEASGSGAGRLLGHEDIDLFTLLPAPSQEGLQILSRENKWVRVQAPPGSIVLNTGDYMQLLSNDKLPSTTHRVAVPRDPGLAQRPRVSFPLAAYLAEDEILAPLPGTGEPRYGPIRAITFHTRSTAKFYGDDYAVEDPGTEGHPGES